MWRHRCQLWNVVPRRLPPRMAMKQTTVLFVDDDAGFLEVVRNLMTAYSEGQWDVLVATAAAQGLTFLKERKIDLLVIDVHMPVMDGLQFLGLLHRRYPNISKAVLTGDSSDPYRAACLSNGAELFLVKPTSPDGWQSLFVALNELVKFQPEEGFRGVLRRVGLQDVLQMECLARSSSVMEVSNAEMQGSIYVQDGQIIHAQVGDLAGEDAFNRLMSLSGGQFNLKPFVQPPSITISGSWEFLLMEAARQRDEALESESQLPPWATPAEPAGAPSVSQPGGEAAIELEDIPLIMQKRVRPSKPQDPVDKFRPTIDEVLICSTQGDVLYEWQCPDANARIRFLQFLSQKSWQMRQGLPIGYFQRLEIESLKNRIVTRIDPDRALFVRASRVLVGA
jgi:CheY-like chemotaxis protein